MENNQLADMQQMTDAMHQYTQTSFKSENEMKMYYLQMSILIRATHTYHSNDSECVALKRLSIKLRQYSAFMQTLGDHKWEKGIVHIQKAVGFYLMQNSVDHQERKQANDEIASLMQSIIFLSGSRGIIKQLQGVLTNHLSNVMHLLKAYPSISESME